MILTFYEWNGLICAQKNGITREREEGTAQIGMNKGFKIESLHDTNLSLLRKTSPREFERCGTCMIRTLKNTYHWLANRNQNAIIIIWGRLSYEDDEKVKVKYVYSQHANEIDVAILINQSPYMRVLVLVVMEINQNMIDVSNQRFILIWIYLLKPYHKIARLLEWLASKSASYSNCKWRCTHYVHISINKNSSFNGRHDLDLHIQEV